MDVLLQVRVAPPHHSIAIAVPPESTTENQPFINYLLRHWIFINLFHFLISFWSEIWEGIVGPKRPVIVLFGSSIVQYSFGNGGWGATLANFYSRQADVVLRGYAGWNSRQALQVLTSVSPKDSPVQPSLVIVYFGGNDSCKPHPDGLGPHVPLSEYKDSMHQIGLYIRGLSETTRVIFLSCPPISETMLVESASTNEARRVYSNTCIEMCNELSHTDPSFKVIDLFSAIQKPRDWADTCFTGDRIHFSAVASDIVVAEILKVLSEAKWEPSLDLDDLLTEFEDVMYPT